jgi:ribose transport system permease protein
MTSPDLIAEAKEPVHDRGRPAGYAHWLREGLRRFSGVYVLIALCIAFGIALPGTFATSQNLRTILTSQSVTGLLALGLLLPLAAGAFDLSVAANMGLATVVCISLQSHGVNTVLACLAAVAVACLVGLVNGLLVIRLKVDSFIATLGMSSVLAALAFKVTNGQQIVNGIPQSFLNVYTSSFLGIPDPVIYLVVAAAIIWFVLEYRPIGRYIYAVGGNRQAARLAGVRVDRIIFGTFIIGGLFAGLAGVLLASELGIGDPNSGPPYLLPVFSAVFLGTTQIRPGRANVVGTLIAIYLLAVGVKGLQLAGSPSYVSDLFNGLALIVAVALAAYERRSRT